MKQKITFKFSTTQIILLSFLITILIGGVLLALPISTKSGDGIPFIDALFTATTATCVTGLVTLPTVSTWSIFGQIVILILIQIGGLGVITVISGLLFAIHRKFNLHDSQLIQDAFNLNSLSGLTKFVKKVVIGTLIVEGVGALLYMIVFVPDFGPKGIWISIFNSVSAFCNAGIDIISETSLCNYATNPIINGVTILLIVLGGLGYIVWWDVIRVLKGFKALKLRCFKHLTLHSKIVITTTAALIFIGAAAIFIFEYNNPTTIGEFNLYEKIQASFFQSVTTRTAGFATVPQENLTNPSVFISMLLMFIGGSPVGTAGGIKTVTFIVIIATALSAIGNKSDVTLFNRNLYSQITRKAVAVFVMSFATVFVSTALLSLTVDAPAIDILFETVSATATVGLTRNFTSLLNAWGKIIIIITMYFGRIGPISLAIAFHFKKENTNIVKNPAENISVG